MSWDKLFGDFLLPKLQMVRASNKSAFLGHSSLRSHSKFESHTFHSEQRLDRIQE